MAERRTRRTREADPDDPGSPSSSFERAVLSQDTAAQHATSRSMLAWARGLGLRTLAAILERAREEELATAGAGARSRR